LEKREHRPSPSASLMQDLKSFIVCSRSLRESTIQRSLQGHIQCVGVRAAAKQDLNDLASAVQRLEVQRCVAVVRRGVHLSAIGDQEFREFRRLRKMQCGQPGTVTRIHVGMFVNRLLGSVEVVCSRSSVQCCVIGLPFLNESFC